jgi:type IV pilus assembly protein PilA
VTDPAKSSKVAIVALVLGVLGLCLFPLSLVGAALGIVALVRKAPVAGGRGLAVGALVTSLGTLVVGLGLQAAIAIPAFVHYVRTSKTAEAVTNVAAISRGVASYWAAERTARDGHVTQSLPPSLPRTPLAPGPERRAWPADASPGWAELGFAPVDPLYYAYEYEASPDGVSFAVRAIGDLDGDGLRSTFEQTGHVEGGAVRLDPLRIENEVE